MLGSDVLVKHKKNVTRKRVWKDDSGSEIRLVVGLHSSASSGTNDGVLG